jgi:gamma-glutamyl-gamma-aminobutyrate hydrolase PuuD
MSRINGSLIATYVRQLYIISKHQEWAEKNQPNQLMEMIEALSVMAEAIGNANAVCIASIDEDAINVLIERTRLQANQKTDDENAPFTELT